MPRDIFWMKPGTPGGGPPGVGLLQQIVRSYPEEDVGIALDREETIHDEPFEVDAPMVADAVLAADATGRAWRRARG
jgi:hypothetical protein